MSSFQFCNCTYLYARSNSQCHLFPSDVPVVADDPLLAAALKNNADTFRKRRLALSLSPEVKVTGPNKIRVLNARANISQRFDSYRLVRLCVVDPCFYYLVNFTAYFYFMLSCLLQTIYGYYDPLSLPCTSYTSSLKSRTRCSHAILLFSLF